MAHFPTRTYEQACAWVKQGACAKRMDWYKEFLYYDRDMERVWMNNGEGLIGAVLEEDRCGSWVACNARGGRPGTLEEASSPSLSTGPAWYAEMDSAWVGLFADPKYPYPVYETAEMPPAIPVQVPRNRAEAEDMVLRGLKYLGIGMLDTNESVLNLQARLDSEVRLRRSVEAMLGNERDDHKATKSALEQSRSNFHELQESFHNTLGEERQVLTKLREKYTALAANLEREKGKVGAFLKASEHLNAAIQALGQQEPHEYARASFWSKLLGLSEAVDYDYVSGPLGNCERPYIKVYGPWSHAIYHLVAHATEFLPKESQTAPKDTDARI